MNITTITNEPERGCGFRKQGGHYLMSMGEPFHCGKLPIPLTICPHCGQGIKFSRGLTWISGKFINDNVPVECPNPSCNEGCFVRNITDEERILLLWVGKGFYKTPEDFIKEAGEMGISRRIAGIPKGFEVGKTIVMLAHKEAIWFYTGQTSGNHYLQEDAPEPTELEYIPAIFYAFIPQRIEYILTEKEMSLIDVWTQDGTLDQLASLTPEEFKSYETDTEEIKIYKKLDTMEKQGVTLVRLERTDGKLS